MQIPVPGDTVRVQGLYCYVTSVSVNSNGIVYVTYKNGSNSTANLIWRFSNGTTNIA